MSVEYRGNGSDFVNGVPARDMSDEEFAALDADRQEHALSSGLYTQVDNVAPVQAADEPAQPAGRRYRAPAPVFSGTDTPAVAAPEVANVEAPAQ